MAATIRDVAKHAGVGVGTVSRVLNGSASVSESTRQKVLAAIEALDYSPNLVARRLSQGKTMTLGVIVPFFTNPSAVKRLQGVVSVVAGSDYDLVLFDVEKDDAHDVFLRNVIQRQIADGLLIISFSPDDDDVARFTQSQVPVVLIDAFHPALSRVVVDNVAGGYRATKYLIELGHHKIGFVSDYLDSPFNTPVRDRFAGYRKALDEAGIPFQSAYHSQGIHGRSQAKLMAHTLFDLPDPPTAIFAYSDTQAIGVMDAAQERHLNIPEDISIIGFDNIEIAELLRLTTVRQSLFDSGVRGAELLLAHMQAIPSTPEELLLPIELLVRRTTAVPTT